MTFIYPRLGEFASRYPDITLDLQVNDQIVDLVAGNFDVGIRAGVLADADVVAYPLLRYRRVTCASPRYLQHHGHPSHPSDLANHTCVTYRHDSLPVSWPYWIDNKLEHIKVRGSYAANEAHALIALARDSLGVTRQPEWLVAKDLREGRLVSLLDEYTAPSTFDGPGIHVIVQRRRYRPAKVDAFVAFVKAVITSDDY